MANVYWHGDGGNWSDFTNHWFNATDGGGGSHGAAPGVDDNAIFDANSFDNPAQTVTVDAAANCLDMDWTGATNTPTLATGPNVLGFYGNVTFIAAMVITGGEGTYILDTATSGTQLVTTNGLSINCSIGVLTAGTGTLSLQDNLTAINLYFNIGGTILTNNYTLNLVSFNVLGHTGTRTLTLGSSTVNISGVGGWKAGADLILTANTATINVSGTGVFAGGGITTYNIVNLNGTAHTISGSNTFASLNLPAGTTQTITFTDGTTQTVGAAALSGSAGHLHTLKGTGTAGWTISKSSGVITCSYMRISYSTATGGATWYAGVYSLNGNSCNGWVFPRGWASK